MKSSPAVRPQWLSDGSVSRGAMENEAVLLYLQRTIQRLVAESSGRRVTDECYALELFLDSLERVLLHHRLRPSFAPPSPSSRCSSIISLHLSLSFWTRCVLPVRAHLRLGVEFALSASLAPIVTNPLLSCSGVCPHLLLGDLSASW